MAIAAEKNPHPLEVTPVSRLLHPTCSKVKKTWSPNGARNSCVVSSVSIKRPGKAWLVPIWFTHGNVWTPEVFGHFPLHCFCLFNSFDMFWHVDETTCWNRERHEQKPRENIGTCERSQAPFLSQKNHELTDTLHTVWPNNFDAKQSNQQKPHTYGLCLCTMLKKNEKNKQIPTGLDPTGFSGSNFSNSTVITLTSSVV